MKIRYLLMLRMFEHPIEKEEMGIAILQRFSLHDKDVVIQNRMD